MTRSPNWAVALRLRHLPARTGRDAVRGGILIFETTPSQTVGPYFAIGLAVGRRARRRPSRHAGRDPDPRHRVRRRRHAGPGLRCSRPGRPIPTVASPTCTAMAGARSVEGFRGFARYGLEDGDGSVRDRHDQARPRAGARRSHAGAAHRRVGVRARDAQPDRDADLLRRRGGGQRSRPGAGKRSGRSP